MCIIADTMNVRVKSVKDQRDVVRPSWIRRCVDSGVLLPFRPEEMLVSSKSTAAQMALSFDEFGNCLLEPTAEEDVPIILNRVQQLVDNDDFTFISFNIVDNIQLKSISIDHFIR